MRALKRSEKERDPDDEAGHSPPGEGRCAGPISVAPFARARMMGAYARVDARPPVGGASS